MAEINIELDFYNNDEREKFRRNYPELFERLEQNIGTVRIPLEDFKAYFLFKHQTTENPGVFSNFLAQVKAKWPYFDDYYRYDPINGEFTSATSDNRNNNEISESLGVAGALAVSSRLFLQSTQADWRKIPQLNVKTADFRNIAAIDGRFLTVEGKGSIVESNTNPSAVSNHKQNILQKKNDVDFRQRYSEDYCYGAITVADPNNRLKTWLVDPPSLPQNIDVSK